MPQLTDDDITRLTTKADGLRVRIAEIEGFDKSNPEKEKMLRVRRKQLADIEAQLPKAATAK